MSSGPPKRATKRPAMRPPPGAGGAQAGGAQAPPSKPAPAKPRRAGLLSSILGGVERHSEITGKVVKPAEARAGVPATKAGDGGSLGGFGSSLGGFGDSLGGFGGSLSGGGNGAVPAVSVGDAQKAAADARRRAYASYQAELAPLAKAKEEGREATFEFAPVERMWRDVQKEAATDLGLISESVGDEGVDRRVAVYSIAAVQTGDDSEDPGGRRMASQAAMVAAARAQQRRAPKLSDTAPRMPVEGGAGLVKLNTNKRDLRTTAEIQEEMQAKRRKLAGGEPTAVDAAAKLKEAQLRAAGLAGDDSD